MITAAKAAKLLSVSETTIRAMLVDGRLDGIVIPPTKQGGRAIYRVNEDAFEKLSTQHHEPGSSKDEPELRLEEI